MLKQSRARTSSGTAPMTRSASACRAIRSISGLFCEAGVPRRCARGLRRLRLSRGGNAHARCFRRSCKPALVARLAARRRGPDGHAVGALHRRQRAHERGVARAVSGRTRGGPGRSPGPSSGPRRSGARRFVPANAASARGGPGDIALADRGAGRPRIDALRALDARMIRSRHRTAPSPPSPARSAARRASRRGHAASRCAAMRERRARPDRSRRRS